MSKVELKWNNGIFLPGKVCFCNEQPFVITIAQINLFIISERLVYELEWIFDEIFEIWNECKMNATQYSVKQPEN